MRDHCEKIVSFSLILTQNLHPDTVLEKNDLSFLITSNKNVSSRNAGPL